MRTSVFAAIFFLAISIVPSFAQPPGNDVKKSSGSSLLKAMRNIVRNGKGATTSTNANLKPPMTTNQQTKQDQGDALARKNANLKVPLTKDQQAEQDREAALARKKASEDREYSPP
ncbi:hypothetical protein F5148DRAFT_1209104 [Russula earlei]|uniref:Uncharacterized protein n=1 Tax=Russula earlei TaxID=71964 RepID=A0ACC0U6U1_9AGAM|nr:hypothetical protein F5148DRAFT_1209104 [Russula earlei]